MTQVEYTLILLIGLLVFGPKNWLKLFQDLRQSPAGQASAGARDRRLLGLAVLLLLVQVTLFALEKAAVITSEQNSIALSVLIIWLIVGWLCFGKGKD